MPFREEHIPVAVFDHLQFLAEGAQDLGQGVAAGPTAQATPKRRTRFVVIGLAKTMGRTAGLAVGLQHHHLLATARQQPGAAQPANAATDHDHAGFASHGVPRGCRQIGASWPYP